jgi:hypothetical protein
MSTLFFFKNVLVKDKRDSRDKVMRVFSCVGAKISRKNQKVEMRSVGIQFFL